MRKYLIALCASTLLSTGALAETQRLCDQLATYDVKPPGDDITAKERLVSGVWKGSILFAGGSEMCLSMVVKEIFPDGRVNLLVAWNVAMGGHQDINNSVGQGIATDWGSEIKDGKIVLDGHNLYHGVHYYYVMDLPTEEKPNVFDGKFMANTDAQPIRLYRQRPRATSVSPSLAKGSKPGN